jgi:hypothetical protein
MNPDPRNMKLSVWILISNLKNPMNLYFTNSLREPHKTRIFKIRVWNWGFSEKKWVCRNWRFEEREIESPSTIES